MPKHGFHALGGSTLTSAQRELDAVLVGRSWSEDAAVALVDSDVVDARFAAAHQSVLVELPELVSVAAPPLPVPIVAFVLEADGDPVSVEGPEVLAECVVELSLPFLGEEGDDLGASTDEGVAVAPDRVLRVGAGDLVRVAAVPGVFGRLDLLAGGLLGEGRKRRSRLGLLIVRPRRCRPGRVRAPGWRSGGPRSRSGGSRRSPPGSPPRRGARAPSRSLASRRS